MAGGIISALNPKYDSNTLSSILQHLQPKFIFVYSKYIDTILESLDMVNSSNPPVIVIVFDPDGLKEKLPKEYLDYDDLIQMGEIEFEPVQLESENDPISVSFTSGSTGEPKGVVYSHRAAYLNSLAMISRCEFPKSKTMFLWTVDMYRCNGWCCIWAVAAIGGTNICIREASGDSIFEWLLALEVTHLCGAPRLLNVIANHPLEVERRFNTNLIVAGVLPKRDVVEKVSKMGFRISHAYGMTEVLGIAIVRTLNPCDRVQNVLVHKIEVKDSDSMKPVPKDGKTSGEIMFKGDILMSGYFRNSKMTAQEGFKDGWFRTGDMAVRHADGFIEIKDRRRDMIESGAEMVSSLEVEGVLVNYPKVLDAAVVGKYVGDELKQEVVCAFVKLREGCEATSDEIVKFCCGHLPSYMVPKRFVFGDIPVNCTGKVQKFILRETADTMF